ncbi:SPOR domain-containing protein [Aurantimonas sp. VKM B-3413]|uniref:SPOR domain-containing protein n=1 Tax=Aurantimonas sp. VKM B-3413 TaxID=2779401 RepID=UPI001E5319DF|nr:SPOR domain-containing protein [Aurantimonas sp. VKM B-3413]MCB8836056.1 SPOR domain-containing protein [Aurantimonas sp. VKM B-3413]
MGFHRLKTALVLAAFAAAMPAESFAASGEIRVAEACGYYAFAGAFGNHRAARRRANRLGAQVLELDNSDSPSAGSGLVVVGSGPMSRRAAERRASQFRREGIGDAYAGYRCFY